MRRRDRIKSRLQRLERLDKGLGVRTHAGEFLQHRHHVERRRIAVGILALRQRPRLLAGGASDTSSIRTSRSVLPFTLVVWEAPSSAMTWSTSPTSLRAKMPKESPTT